jgi:hypothetical protein
MRSTSVRLPDDLRQRWKASRVSLREVVRLGLAAVNRGTPALSAASGGRISSDVGPGLTVSSDWMTVQQAADTLSIGESRVHHLLSVGYLESRKAEDGWRRLVSAESVRAELGRRERARQGIRPPYADAASAYQAETEAAWRTAMARHT